MNIRTAFIMLTLGGAALCGARLAYPAESNVFSGNACLPLDADDAPFINHYGDLTKNIDYEPGELGYHQVVCPVVSRNSLTTAGTKGAYIRVQSYDGQQLYCQLCSYTPYGSVAQCTSAITRSDTAVALHTDLSASVRNGYYSYYCDLPPQSAIFSYRIEEF